MIYFMIDTTIQTKETMSERKEPKEDQDGGSGHLFLVFC